MSARQPHRPHLLPIRITPEDIDLMGHVNNASYLGWVQDPVLTHWRKLAPAEAVAQHLWVALRHEITYRKPAFLQDDIIARTALEKVAGARAFYTTVIARLGDLGEEVLAEVSSMWCCLNAATRRPARIDPSLAAGFGLPGRGESGTS
jgi:acyl-CoA thioester hydrolase